jgi:hypothetical protein
MVEGWRLGANASAEWIPAFAGMTDVRQDDEAGLRGCAMALAHRKHSLIASTIDDLLRIQTKKGESADGQGMARG